MSRELEYKVEEVVKVTAEDLEACVNLRTSEGWTLDRVDYVKDPSVRRPQMAFVWFTRIRPEDTP